MMNGEKLVPAENIMISQSENPGFHLSVRHTVSLPTPLPKTITNEIAQFWQQRRVIFSAISDNLLYGQRGSLWWNAITFDMSKLRSDLTITLDKEEGKVECLLDVKTTLQQITPMNQMYWVEEMTAFESYLQSGDEKAEEWAEFQNEYRKDNKRWVWGIIITVGITLFLSQVTVGLITWLLSLLTDSK
jgi:hypothetical protein